MRGRNRVKFFVNFLTKCFEFIIKSHTFWYPINGRRWTPKKVLIKKLFKKCISPRNFKNWAKISKSDFQGIDPKFSNSQNQYDLLNQIQFIEIEKSMRKKVMPISSPWIQPKHDSYSNTRYTKNVKSKILDDSWTC